MSTPGSAETQRDRCTIGTASYESGWKEGWRWRWRNEREWSGLLKIVIAADERSAIVAFHVSMLRDASGGEHFFESAEWAELAP